MRCRDNHIGVILCIVVAEPLQQVRLAHREVFRQTELLAGLLRLAYHVAEHAVIDAVGYQGLGELRLSLLTLTHQTGTRIGNISKAVEPMSVAQYTHRAQCCPEHFRLFRIVHQT